MQPLRFVSLALALALGTSCSSDSGSGASGTGGSSGAVGAGGSAASSAGGGTNPNAGGAGGSSSGGGGTANGGVAGSSLGGTSGSGAGGAGAWSCQLVAADGGVLAQCGMSGEAADGDPCLSAVDCGAQLGCIATGVTPICRAYCCDGPESCPTDTYCAKGAMAEAPQDLIPICIPAMKCALLNDSTCPAGLTCTIVRAAGTTSCVTPGTGTYGEPCPCAAGFACNADEGTCFQLCHTGSSGDCGPQALCQGGASQYPAGIGYCVSY